jgi:thiol-disulfide isomerase/thioredoxin
MRIFAPAHLALAVVIGTLVMACGGSDASPSAKTAASEKSSGGGDGKGVKQGDKAPSFSIDSLNGTSKLTIAPGKVTIVDFWATWCDPCKKSFPKLQELYVKYKTNGLEIVAISVDEDSDKGKIPDFVKTHGAKFPVGWGGKALADRWNPEKMPSSYIIGKDGVVKHIHRGYHDGEEAELEKELKALF